MTDPLPALLDPGALRDLRAALEDADYTVDSVVARIGEQGQAALGRNTTVAASRALDAAPDDALATLVRLFVLQQSVDGADARKALPVAPLVDAGVLVGRHDRIAAGLDIRPVASPDDGASGWVVSDLTPGLDQQVVPMRPDYVLGVSPASTTLTQLTIPDRAGSALDLGTGCGIQALHLSRHADRVVATDLNPRALQHARLTADLNLVDLELRLGSLYEPVAGERFDLIVTNPPYVMSPPSGERLTYREGSHRGDGLVEAVVRGAPARLNDGGTLQVLGNWAVVRGQDPAERLAGWVADTGADLWVIERERLDVHEYIEVWLTDAGLTGGPLWRERYDQWLDYFDDLGVEAVGMGWITLTMAGRSTPDVTVESWPWAVAQPVGSALARRRQDVTLATAAEDDLLGRSFVLRDDVREETHGRPGAAGPEQIVLRQRTGLCRAIDADTAQAAVLGACDGDLPLGAILTAVAQLLEADPDDLRAEQLPLFRTALREGFLG